MTVRTFTLSFLIGFAKLFAYFKISKWDLNKYSIGLMTCWSEENGTFSFTMTKQIYIRWKDFWFVMFTEFSLLPMVIRITWEIFITITFVPNVRGKPDTRLMYTSKYRRYSGSYFVLCQHFESFQKNRFGERSSYT